MALLLSLVDNCVFQNDAFQNNAFQVCSPLDVRRRVFNNPPDGPAPRYLLAACVGLNLCLAAAAAPTPVKAYDWPNPQLGKQRVVADWIKPSPLGNFDKPFNQGDWPNPRGYQRPVADHVAGSTWLLSEVPLGEPFQQEDWPVPKAAPPSQRPADWIWPSPLGNFAKPFAQTDWPNPRGPLRGNQDWTWPTPLWSFQLQPFAETDWPNPRGYQRPVADYVVGSPTTLTVTPAAPAVPFSQSDWPVPKGPQRGQQWIWPTPLWSFKLQPFNQTDWPVPKGAQRPVADFVAPYPQVYGEVPLGEPFQQEDWPVPKGPQRPVADWIKPTPLWSFQLKPFSQSDWPVPRGYARSVQDWTRSGCSPLITFVQANPFNQYDWPVPKGYRRPVADHIQSSRLHAFKPQPFSQSDWPVPKGYRRPVADYTQSSRLWAFKLQPFRQADWPLPPKARKPVVADYVAAPSLSIRSPAAKPPIRQYDWPVPKGYRRSVSLLTWHATFVRAFASYQVNLTAGIELSGDLHVCGWGTEGEQTSLAYTEEDQQGDQWSTQAEVTELEPCVFDQFVFDASVYTVCTEFAEVAEDADPWGEQAEGGGDWEEQEECGR